MSFEYYKTKQAMKIITKLPKKYAYELFRVVDTVQDTLCMYNIVIPSVDAMDKNQAIHQVEIALKEKGVEIPEHLKESFWRFLKVMIDERAHMDELAWEYNRALCPLIHYDLFEPDA